MIRLVIIPQVRVETKSLLLGTESFLQEKGEGGGFSPVPGPCGARRRKEQENAPLSPAMQAAGQPVGVGLEDELAPELQAAPADAIGGDVGCAEATVGTAVGVVGQAAELVDAADVGSVDVHVGNAKPLMIEEVERVGL